MQSIDQSGTDGERLATKEWGDPDDPRLVLVHGFTQSAQSWSRLAADLAADYAVVAVDLPGHGRSAHISPENLATAAHLVGASGGRGIYIGYSLGARVALTLALNRPELVDALVLISSSPGIVDLQERSRRREADWALAERLDPSDGSKPRISIEQFLEEWLAQPLFCDLDELAQDRGSRVHNSTCALGRSLRATSVGEMEPLHQRLAELKMPVLCLAGERDLLYVGRARETASMIGRNAAARIISGAGHALCFERPREFLRVLGDFLENLPG
ncbi:MAG TPA: alpha/beta fold hydrolase [Acidimicrobiales bacterium]|nr:alpha/beta fold hydrolase [Acidimicrobiales bacterium]